MLVEFDERPTDEWSSIKHSIFHVGCVSLDEAKSKREPKKFMPMDFIPMIILVMSSSLEEMVTRLVRYPHLKALLPSNSVVAYEVFELTQNSKQRRKVSPPSLCKVMF